MGTKRESFTVTQEESIRYTQLAQTLGIKKSEMYRKAMTIFQDLHELDIIKERRKNDPVLSYEELEAKLAYSV